MKKIVITLLLFVSLIGYSQTNGITYQALIIDPSGEQLPGVNNANAPLANKNICLKFSIIDQNSQFEYIETAQTTTDEFGMVNLIIGTGNQIGGYASSFSTILWNANPKSLKVDLSTTGVCSYYTEISNQPFTAVPFALYAVNSESTAAIAALQATVAANATATTNTLASKEDTANKSTTTTLGTSNVLFPTQNAVKTYVDSQVASATIPDANATTKGKIQLAGDLGGTAAAPTVPGLANKENSTNKSTVTTLGNSDVLFPTQNAVKTYVDTNISTVNAATATALALKANTASLATVATSGNYNDLTNTPTVPAAYSLPNASASTLGGIKVGSNLSIDSNGVLSGVSSYSLPTATATELGGIKVGSGLTITNGVLSASGSGVPYTGATQAVDLGAFDLKVNGITVGRGNGNLASNTATGKDALLSNNTIGANNTAMGNQALYSNTFGSQNTAIGSGSLKSNINGIQNTAVGILSLEKNVGVSYNTAVGAEALRNTIDGESNTATGASALKSNISGAYNSAFGRNALVSSTASYNNAAFGAEALSDNLANGNSAYGAYALQRNTTGYSNTAVGIGAMKFHTTGNDNVAIGVNAGLFASNQTTGSNNTAVGAFAEYGAANLTNATVIGSGAIVSTSNTIQLGNTAVTNVKTSGTITAGAVTYPKVDGTTGQVLTANANGIPSWQTIATSPLVSPNFTGTPTAPTATAGTNTTQIATTEFVTGAIASATIPDATNSTKGKVKLAGDLAGTADAPTVPGLALKANASDVTTSLATKEDASNKSNAALGTSSTLFPTQNAVKTYVDNQIASATIVDADASTKGKLQLAGDLGGTAAAPTVPGLALKANASDVTISLATKEDTSNKSNAALGTSTTLFPTQNAVKTYVDAQVASATIADANATTKGKLQLAGDLGGTAAAPTVPGLALKAPLATPTFTGTVTAPIYASAPQNLTSGTAISWNPNAGLNANLTLAHNGTLSFSTAPTAGSYGTLVITQDATGGRTLTLPSGTNLVLGSTSTTTVSLSTDANIKDILNFYFDGTTYFWNIGKGFGTTATFTANSIAGGAAGAIPYQTGGGVTGFLARGTDGQILTLASGLPSWAAAPVTGVTSVAMSTPTGLTVSGSPITSTGTLALSLSTGYTIPTTTSQTNWDAAYTNRITSANSPLSIASNALSLGTVLIGSGGTGATNKTAAFDALSPMSSPGDIIYGTSGGSGTRLAKGSDNQVLTVINGLPVWSTITLPQDANEESLSTLAQTSFTLGHTPVNTSKVKMYINGIRITNSAYSISGRTVSYNAVNNGAYALALNDRIQFDYQY
jgi:hypothetical protein